MKNTIYMLIFMLLPISTWAQFDNFVEIEYITKGSEKTLNYDVFPCGLDTKVIVNRTAAKENNLTIEFKGFDGSSIERETLTVGASTYIKSFGLENHLVILMGTESGMNEGSVLTGVLVVSYKDKKVISIGESEASGKYKPVKSGAFMSTRTTKSFKEMGNSIAFEDKGKLQLFNLKTKKIIPIDLKLKSTHVAYDIIPSTTKDEAHILTARNGNKNEMKILKINSSGSIIGSHVLDEKFTQDINTSSLKFCEESGNYYAVGFAFNVLKTEKPIIKLYTFIDRTINVKYMGFKSGDSFELTDDTESFNKLKGANKIEFNLYRRNDKTFILTRYYEVKTQQRGQINDPRALTAVTKTLESINLIILNGENKIINQSSFPIEQISELHMLNFTAFFNPDNSTINYVSSDTYSYSGISLLAFNTESKEATSELLFDGYAAYPTLRNNRVFFLGYFKDGEPYTLQISKEDAMAKPAFGFLEF
jgi:hypothetical protein